MKLQRQVCSSDQAFKFKELGIDQTSITFAYVAESPDKNVELVFAGGYDWNDYPCYAGYPTRAAAFTVAELGVMLGEGKPSWQFILLYLLTNKGPKEPLGLQIFENPDLNPRNIYSAFDRYKPTEAAARAKLLISAITCGMPGFTIDDINERLKNA